jgi:hypothetical protein
LFLTALKLGHVNAIKVFLKHDDTKSKNAENILQKAIFICIRNYEEATFYNPILINIIKESNICLDFEDYELCPPLQLSIKK